MTDPLSVTLSTPGAVRLSGPLNRLVMVIVVLVLFTSSFDIFLVLNAGGSYRFCQIITPALIILAVIKATRGKRKPVLGALPLLIWLVFQVLFIPTTGFWQKSLAYCLWLSLNIGLVYSCVQLFGNDSKSLATVLRWYVYSFAFVAVFGLVQFILPLLGFAGPLVTQWWIPVTLARANGFSYEPSYFATYLIIGFVFVGSLRRNRSPLLSARTMLVIYCLIGLGVVVSSSRMGVLFLCLDIFLYQLRPWRAFLADLLKLRIVIPTVRALIPSILSIALICVTLVGLSSLIQKNPALALIFLNGTGISDTAAHSVVQREDALEETFAVFLQHPLIGRSLGGVSVAIGDLEGKEVRSFEDSKDFEGMSVFAEALAASGMIGIIPFVSFVFATVRKPLKLACRASPFDSVLLRALVRSLLFAWAILQFNQNMLRPYLWTHLAILAAVYAAVVQPVAAPAEVRNLS